MIHSIYLNRYLFYRDELAMLSHTPAQYSTRKPIVMYTMSSPRDLKECHAVSADEFNQLRGKLWTLAEYDRVPSLPADTALSLNEWHRLLEKNYRTDVFLRPWVKGGPAD